MSEKTRHNVKERGISLWIKADIDVLMERVGRRDNRPLLKTEDPRAVMLSLIEARYPVYATADITVESRDLPHELMVHEIIEELLKFDKTSLETRGERSK